MRVFDFNLFVTDMTIDPDIKRQLWKYLYVVDGAHVRVTDKANDQGEISPADSMFYKYSYQYVSLRWTKKISIVKYLKWKKERLKQIKEEENGRR